MLNSPFPTEPLPITGSQQDTSWESQLGENTRRVAQEIFERFPYIPGFKLVWDTNFDSGNFDTNNAYLRFTNFRYEPIIYFEED